MGMCVRCFCEMAWFSYVEVVPCIGVLGYDTF